MNRIILFEYYLHPDYTCLFKREEVEQPVNRAQGGKAPINCTTLHTSDPFKCLTLKIFIKGANLPAPQRAAFQLEEGCVPELLPGSNDDLVKRFSETSPSFQGGDLDWLYVASVLLPEKAETPQSLHVRTSTEKLF